MTAHYQKGHRWKNRLSVNDGLRLRKQLGYDYENDNIESVVYALEAELPQDHPLVELVKIKARLVGDLPGLPPSPKVATVINLSGGLKK